MGLRGKVNPLNPPTSCTRVLAPRNVVREGRLSLSTLTLEWEVLSIGPRNVVLEWNVGPRNVGGFERECPKHSNFPFQSKRLVVQSNTQILHGLLFSPCFYLAHVYCV